MYANTNSKNRQLFKSRNYIELIYIVIISGASSQRGGGAKYAEPVNNYFNFLCLLFIMANNWINVHQIGNKTHAREVMAVHSIQLR